MQMIGNNELHLNEATLCLAVQKYLDSGIIGATVLVKSVKYKSSPGAGDTFIFDIAPKDPPKT